MGGRTFHAVVALRLGNRPVTRRSHTGVPLTYHPQPLILAREVIGSFKGAVRRTVVHDENLDLAQSLRTS